MSRYLFILNWNLTPYQEVFVFVYILCVNKRLANDSRTLKMLLIEALGLLLNQLIWKGNAHARTNLQPDSIFAWKTSPKFSFYQAHCHVVCGFKDFKELYCFIFNYNWRLKWFRKTKQNPRPNPFFNLSVLHCLFKPIRNASMLIKFACSLSSEKPCVVVIPVAVFNSRASSFCAFIWECWMVFGHFQWHVS